VSSRTKLTPPELARRWGIGGDKVLTWIRNGELRAINVATRLASRPRYLIDERDVVAFESARAVIAKPTIRRQRKRRSTSVIAFF